MAAFAIDENESSVVAQLYKPDIAISLNAPIEKPHGAFGVFWHFNERIGVDEIPALGWDAIVTNSRAIASEYGYPYVALACDPETHAAKPCADCSGGVVGYVGNWHGSKTTSEIDRYLVSVSEECDLKIWGSPRWKEHSALAKCYVGALDPALWPYLRSYASVWINWRTAGQKAMRSMNCRAYCYLAAGAHVLCDMPEDDDLDCVDFISDESWTRSIKLALETPRKMTQAQISEALSKHSYAKRAQQIMEIAAGSIGALR